MDSDEFDAHEADEAKGRERRAFRNGLFVGCLVSVAFPTVLAVIGLVLMGILIESGRIPDSAAVPGQELNASTIELLRNEGLIESDEQVIYYYSDGLLSHREDGNLFSDRRVVSYWEQGEEIQVESAPYHEIESLTFSPDEDFFGTSTITVERADESTFQLVVGNEDDRDSEFFELLDETWKNARNGEPARPGDELDREVLDFLRSEQLVDEGEEVLFFYAKTSGSLRADGNLFTDRRVISYWGDQDEIFTNEALYPEITDIEVGWGEGRHEVTTLSVARADGDSLTLWVSPEESGDRAFVARLMATWEANR